MHIKPPIPRMNSPNHNGTSPLPRTAQLRAVLSLCPKLDKEEQIRVKKH